MDDGAPLAGAAFDLWRETNGTPGLQTTGADPDTMTGRSCTTDAAGTCAFDGLPLGGYYLVETAVPEGYELPDDPVSGPHELTAENAGDGVTVARVNEGGGYGDHDTGYGDTGGYGHAGTGYGAHGKKPGEHGTRHAGR